MDNKLLTSENSSLESKMDDVIACASEIEKLARAGARMTRIKDVAYVILVNIATIGMATFVVYMWAEILTKFF